MSNYCIDANILLTGWRKNGSNSYCPDVFPTLWDRLLGHKKQIILIKPMYDEICGQSDQDDIAKWTSQNFSPLPVTDKVKSEYLKLTNTYETKESGSGANSNDMLLITYAKLTDNTVVTFENKQPNEPGEKSRYRIPLICKKEKVNCIDFIDMLRNLGIKV